MGDESFLTDLRDAVKAFTEADPYFADDIPVLNERLKDIEGKIDEKLGPLGTGICIVLVTPGVGGVLVNVTGANFRECLLVARILEDVTLNETGKPALDAAIKLTALWSQARPDTFSSALVPTDQVITLGNDPKYLSYDVTFTTESGTKIEIPKLSAPVVDAGSLASVSLTCATPGAAIFYTLDGSAPVPRNPAAQLFQAPFMGTGGQTLRARAWLAGYIPSPETRRII